MRDALAAVCEAILALPRTPESESVSITAEAEKIVLISRDAAKEDLWRSASWRKTEQELDWIQKHARELSEYLDTMRTPANRALSAWGSDPKKMSEMLSELANTAARPEAKDFAKNLSNDRSGRRSYRQPFIVAYQCALTWWLLTGRQPTMTVSPLDNSASGPYLDFVSSIFAALQIDASAERWARRAKDEIRRNHLK